MDWTDVDPKIAAAMKAIDAYLRGDRDAMVSACLIWDCDQDWFAAAGSFAALLTRDMDGPIGLELVRMDPTAEPDLKNEAFYTAMTAFIAAEHNNDGEGMNLVWQQLDLQERMGMTTRILTMAAETVRAELGR